MTRHTVIQPGAALIVTVLVVAGATLALAADTVEPFDAGLGNFELYGAFDGAGQPTGEQSVAGDMLLGWGLSSRFSAYLGTTMQANGYLTGSETGYALGALGTMHDTDHLDLDLILDLRTVGGSGGVFTVSPGFELNLDRAPDLAAYGAYLRGNVSLAGEQSPDGPRRATDLAFTVGSYLTLSGTRQLLVEVDLGMVDEFEGGHAWEYGAVALGYNQAIAGGMELINQVTIDIPQDGESSTVGFMVGVIAAVPGASR
ncbi:hypothetical protein GF314_03140 [bacterium]|nr:hypothetical protein [bacterium]